MQGIPEPQDTGSSGAQEAEAPEVIPPEASSPTAGLPIVQKLEGLAAASPRSLGGEVSAGLIAASAGQLHYWQARTESELQHTKGQLDLAKEQLAQSRQRCSVLAERLRSHRRMRHINNLTIVLGTALIGLAIDLGIDLTNLHSVALLVIGVLLLFFGLLAYPGEAEE